MKYDQYVLFPECNMLGIMSTERATLNKEIKCPWGGKTISPSDPYFITNKGLFDRHLIPYPKYALHVGMWKFEESDDYECLVGNNLIGVEANPIVYENYSKITSELYKFKSFNYAASNIDNQDVNIYFYPERMDCSSENFQYGMNSQIVKSKRMDSLIYELGIEIDFINIDAEGAELKILLGLGDKINNINSIIIETSLNDKFNSGSTFENVTNFLNKKGFSIAEIDSKMFKKEYMWGDVYFVRK